MSDLYWLSDTQMAKLRPFFPEVYGKPRVDDMHVLSGIVQTPTPTCPPSMVPSTGVVRLKAYTLGPKVRVKLPI